MNFGDFLFISFYGEFFSKNKYFLTFSFFFQNTFCKLGKTHHKKKFNDPLVRQGFLFSFLLSFTILKLEHEASLLGRLIAK